MQPLPPSPAWTLNVDFVDEHRRERRLPADQLCSTGTDADHAAVRAVIGELHVARDLGEERVVLAAADVQARLEAAAALAHEDRAAGHEVAVEPLDAQPLRVAVAPVAGTALSFFVAMAGFLARIRR